MATATYEPEVFEIRKAARHAVPQIMAISGVTFSGKTFGALMLAAGLIDAGEKVGFVDTENGRGSMYADDPDVQRVLPQGYFVIELQPEYHPRRFIEANQALERAGCKVIITDSGSHAWEGEGGGLDMKEKDKGWKNAKLWTRRFSMALRTSHVHQIVCLRAQEKTKIITGANGKQEYVPLGILPICEKNFPFDLGLFFTVDGEIDGRPATHYATPRKYPKAMNGLFDGWKPQLLTPEIGRRIREWNESAPAEDPIDRLRKQARYAAGEGTTAYAAFYAALSPGKKKALYDTDHEANKKLAAQADSDVPSFGTAADPAEWPDSFDGPAMNWNGQRYEFDESSGNYRKKEQV